MAEPDAESPVGADRAGAIYASDGRRRIPADRPSSCEGVPRSDPTCSLRAQVSHLHAAGCSVGGGPRRSPPSATAGFNAGAGHIQKEIKACAAGDGLRPDALVRQRRAALHPRQVGLQADDGLPRAHRRVRSGLPTTAASTCRSRSDAVHGAGRVTTSHPAHFPGRFRPPRGSMLHLPRVGLVGLVGASPLQHADDVMGRDRRTRGRE